MPSVADGFRLNCMTFKSSLLHEHLGSVCVCVYVCLSLCVNMCIIVGSNE